jgi:hypothetical protein
MRVHSILKETWSPGWTVAEIGITEHSYPRGLL